MRRDVGGRRKTRGRWLFDGRRGAGLASAIAPVAVGVVLAFAWNTAGSYKPAAPAPDPGLSPEVEVAAEQAAAQTWASRGAGPQLRNPRAAAQPSRA